MWRIFPPKVLEKIRALKIRMRHFLKKKIKLCTIYIANEYVLLKSIKQSAQLGIFYCFFPINHKRFVFNKMF